MGVDMIGVIEVNRGDGWKLAVTVEGMPYDRPHDLLQHLPDPPRGIPAGGNWFPDEELMETASYWTLEELCDAFEGDGYGPPDWPDSTLLCKVFALMDSIKYACHVKDRHVRWVWGLS